MSKYRYLIILVIFLFISLGASLPKAETPPSSMDSGTEDIEQKVTTMWEERRFEIEMKTNLSRYLPDPFQGEISNIRIDPVNMEERVFRVYFTVREKNYFMDLSYMSFLDPPRFDIESESKVNQLSPAAPVILPE